MRPYEEIYKSIQPLLNGSSSESAIAALSNLINSFPDFAQAHNDLGVLYYQSGEKQRALNHYEQAAQLEPGNIVFKKSLADFYYSELGQAEEALKLYENILTVAPDDVQTLLLVGHISVSLNRFDAAKEKYRRVLEIEPWNADASQYLEALENQATGENTTKTAEAMYQEIEPTLNSGQPAVAIQALEKLSANYPDFAPAHNDLGVLYYQAGEKERALNHYEQAVQLEPGNIVFKKNLADFYYVEQSRVEDALRIYVDVLAIEPEDVETLQIIGHICEVLDKFEDAKVFYNRILEIEPWNAEAQEFIDKLQDPGKESSEQNAPDEIYQKIQSEMDGKDPQAVIEALEKLSAAAPEFAPAHNDLGVLYYQAGEKERALNHYEQAAQLEPGNITFKKNLADFYYVEQSRVEDALRIYVDVLAIEPEDIETLQITGHICVALDKFEDAKVFYNRVLEIEPWNTEARNFLKKLQLKERAV